MAYKIRRAKRFFDCLIDQWFSVEEVAILHPKGHLVMFVDIFACHNWLGGRIAYYCPLVGRIQESSLISYNAGGNYLQ